MARLVLIPGLACDAAMWQSQLSVLPSQLQAQVTEVHARHASIEAMADALLREYGGRLVLCGASMGGMVAMEAARQAPERICGLALLGTTARQETEDMRRLRALAIGLFESGRAAEVLRANVPLAFHPANPRLPELVEHYMDFVLKAGAEQLVRQNRAVMARPDARLHLGALECPVLVLCGDSDQLTPPECAREIAALVPQAEFALVPECGHMLTMEQPDIVNDSLLRWLPKAQGAA